MIRLKSNEVHFTGELWFCFIFNSFVFLGFKNMIVFLVSIVWALATRLFDQEKKNDSVFGLCSSCLGERCWVFFFPIWKYLRKQYGLFFVYSIKRWISIAVYCVNECSIFFNKTITTSCDKCTLSAWRFFVVFCHFNWVYTELCMCQLVYCCCY